MRLGKLMARSGIRLIFGGGQVGLMGITAQAALSEGGEVVGIIPKFLDEVEVGLKGCSELIITPDMHSRKQKMAAMSDGFVVLPGGFGTLDETFEILTWKQLGLHDKPIVIIDLDGYWRPLTELIDNMVAENYARPENRELFRVVDRIEEILPVLATMPASETGVETKLM